MDDEFLTVKEAAQKKHCSVVTIRHKIAKGELDTKEVIKGRRYIIANERFYKIKLSSRGRRRGGKVSTKKLEKFELLSLSQAAQLKGCAISTVYFWREQGKIDYIFVKGRKCIVNNNRFKEIKVGKPGKPVLENICDIEELQKERHLSVFQAAQIKDCSIDTIYNWIKKGTIDTEIIIDRKFVVNNEKFQKIFKRKSKKKLDK